MQETFSQVYAELTRTGARAKRIAFRAGRLHDRHARGLQALIALRFRLSARALN